MSNFWPNLSKYKNTDFHDIYSIYIWDTVSFYHKRQAYFISSEWLEWRGVEWNTIENISNKLILKLATQKCYLVLHRKILLWKHRRWVQEWYSMGYDIMQSQGIKLPWCYSNQSGELPPLSHTTQPGTSPESLVCVHVIWVVKGGGGLSSGGRILVSLSILSHTNTYTHPLITQIGHPTKICHPSGQKEKGSCLS